MDFSKLNQISEARKVFEKKKASEFDVSSFLNRADKLTNQINLYFMEEPNEFLDVMDKFDQSNDFAVSEMEISAAEILRKNL